MTADLELDELDMGERSAIQLAIDEKAELLLMDERAGVAAARARGLTFIGTLGVLLQAFRHGLVDLDSALAKLRSTTFRSTPELIEEVKRRAFDAAHD
jgi:predicted nucleic acid-binding protein